MECKYGSTDFNFRPFLGINRYTDVRGLGEAFSELIDTLWNVKDRT